MRSNWSSAVVVVTVLLSLGAAVGVRAEDADFPHWPFDDGTYVPHDTDDAEARPWWPGSRLAAVAWPTVELPEYRLFPRLADHERSFVLGQGRTSAMQFVVNTPSRMAGRVRGMWNHSLELLSFGGHDDYGSSQSSGRRPLFGRLFGGGKKTKGPRTVNEWMEQDRIDP